MAEGQLGPSAKFHPAKQKAIRGDEMKKEKRIEVGKALQALTKSTGQNEAVAGDGGVLVQNNLLPTILSPDFLSGTLYSRCKIYNLGDNTSGAKIPISAETSRNTNGIAGGVCAYWVAEGVEKTASNATFDILDLGLNKACVVIYVTDEIKQDSELLAQYVSKTAQDAIKFLVDRAIVYGGGANMNGIQSHAATGFSAISSPITAAELKDIYDLYYGSANGVWVFSQDLWIEVTDLWDTATQTPQIPLTWDADGVARLWGLPVIVNSAMSDRSFVLGDFTQYVIVQKEMTEAVNTSLKFVEDESAYRFVVRINGSPYWKGPVVTWDGQTVHPFVMKNAEAVSSSSSSSSSTQSESSSSTSSESVGNVSSSTSSFSGDTNSSSSTSSASSASSLSSESSSSQSSVSSSSSSSSYIQNWSSTSSSSSESEGNVSTSSASTPSSTSSRSSASSESDE